MMKAMRSLWLTAILALGTADALDQTANLLGSRAPGSACRPKAPSPAGRICGVRGSFKKPFGHDTYMLAENQFTTLSNCRDLCLHRVDVYDQGRYSCKAFAHDSATGNCTLIPAELSLGDIVVNNKKSTTFFEKQCFTCARGCPQTGTENMLDNGGFELSSKAIGPWYQKNESVYDYDIPNAKIVSPGHHSSHALFLPGFSSISQQRDMCVNQTYTLAIDVKVDSQSGDPMAHSGQLSIAFANLDLEVILYAHEGWQTVFTTFDTLLTFPYSTGAYDYPYPPGAKSEYQFFFLGFTSSYDPYSTYLDNFEVRLAPAAFPTTEKNLVANGGFESGKLAPWTVEWTEPGDTYRVATPGLTEGQYSFSSRSYSFGSDSHFQAQIFLRQNVQLQTQPGTLYLLTLDYIVHGESNFTSTVNFVGYVYMGGVTWEIKPEDNQIYNFRHVFTARSPTGEIGVITDAFSEEAFVFTTRVDNVKIRALA